MSEFPGQQTDPGSRGPSWQLPRDGGSLRRLCVPPPCLGVPYWYGGEEGGVRELERVRGVWGYPIGTGGEKGVLESWRGLGVRTRKRKGVAGGTVGGGGSVRELGGTGGSRAGVRRGIRAGVRGWILEAGYGVMRGRGGLRGYAGYGVLEAGY